MSNKNYARRTVVKLYFKGADISKELSKYLLSLSFTDKEEDETDDISLSLDDREGKWIKDWLNTSKAVKTKTETVTTGGGEIKVGAIVKFKGGPVYISSMAAEPTVNRGASTCKCTIANHNAHPYHLISQDGQRVYGWCNASDVEGGQATTTTKTTVIKEKKAFKGTEIHAILLIRVRPLSTWITLVPTRTAALVSAPLLLSNCKLNTEKLIGRAIARPL